MKVLIITLIILKITYISFSQDESLNKKGSAKSISFNASLGYAGYDINSYKSSFALLPVGMDFPAQVTDNFPNQPYISGEILLDFKNSSFGLFYNKISTGGRIAYSDYSGKYRLDSKLNTTTFGLVLFIKLKESEYFDIGIDFKGGICDFSNDVSESITILNVNNTENSTSNFTYFNLGFGGRANLYYSIFRLGLNLGFLTEFENATNVSWIGTRSSLILGIRYKLH